MLTMTKQKMIPAAYNKLNNTTTIFGYSLFALTVLSFFISTIVPFSLSLQYPGAKHLNIIAMVLAFAISTILPALASYLIGDKATHAKNKALHHYNGVLFGFAAYWAAVLLSWVGFGSVVFVSEIPFPIPLLVSNIIPVLLAIGVMAIIASTYTKRKNNKTTVLQYLPFQIVLAVSVLGAFTFPYITGFFKPDFSTEGIVWNVIPVVAIIIAYILLAKQHRARLARLSDAIIAMTIGWVMVWLTQSFIFFLPPQYQMSSIVGYAVGVVAFGAYLYLRTRRA
jgi:MFS family permease